MKFLSVWMPRGVLVESGRTQQTPEKEHKSTQSFEVPMQIFCDFFFKNPISFRILQRCFRKRDFLCFLYKNTPPKNERPAESGSTSKVASLEPQIWAALPSEAVFFGV